MDCHKSQKTCSPTGKSSCQLQKKTCNPFLHPPWETSLVCLAFWLLTQVYNNSQPCATCIHRRGGIWIGKLYGIGVTGLLSDLGGTTPDVYLQYLSRLQAVSCRITSRLAQHCIAWSLWSFSHTVRPWELCIGKATDTNHCSSWCLIILITLAPVSHKSQDYMLSYDNVSSSLRSINSTCRLTAARYTCGLAVEDTERSLSYDLQNQAIWLW